MAYSVQTRTVAARHPGDVRTSAIQTILVGVDERPGWARVLHTAGQLAHACGAVLTVVDLRPAVDPRGSSGSDADDIDHLDVLARRFPDVVLQGLAARGHGAHTLLALAAEVGADLVVVPEAAVQPGGRRPGAERRIAGRCPVVVVPA